jgi:archaellum component FlaC
MNRSLLLVVCDFLLLSILALARFDVPMDADYEQADKKLVDKGVVERISDGENYDDVVAELEATNETLLENLSSDKDDLVEQKLELEEQIAQRRKELAEKEKQIDARDETIAQNEADIQAAKVESEQLEAQRQEIERKREALLQSNAASKKELEILAKNLADAKKRSDELAALKEKKERETESIKVELAATQERAKAEEQRATEAKALLLEEKKRSDALIASTTKLDEKIDTLNLGLQGVGQDLKVVGEGLAGVGDKIANVSNEVTSVKEDVSKVGQDLQGVKQTVSNVSEEVAGVGSKVDTIQQGVAENAAEQKENFRQLSERQTKTVNEIFSKYEENKIKLTFNYSYTSGLFSKETVETFTMDTIIMVDGSFAYSLVHAKDSPFKLEPFPRKLIKVSGEITSPKLKSPIPVTEIAFMDDPRILIVPLYVNPVELRKTSSIELFSSPDNPYLFSEAVVVDAKDGRFGQTDFVRDERDARYIKVSHTRFAFVTGAFDPGKGDLVFSQKGEVLGILVNRNYAFHVKNLGARIHAGSRTTIGEPFNSSKTNLLTSSLKKKLFGLSNKFR